MHRRSFIRHLGGVAAYCSLAMRTSWAGSTATPVIGFLSALTREPETSLGAFQRGLKESGFGERQAVSIEYRWAEDHYDRLPILADELVQLGPAVIVAANQPAAVAAKKATRTIPIVFLTAIDPVTSGLVESLNHPNGNATGVYILSGLLEAKRLELMQQQIVPGLAVVGVLVNPNFPEVQRKVSDLKEASKVLGVNPIFMEVSSERDLPGVFETLTARGAEGLLVTTDPFLYTYRNSITELAARHRIPAIYPFIEYVNAGGLISYGTDLPAAFNKLGVYAAAILKGEKVADLPVEQSTNVALTLNLKTAKALGFVFSQALEARADAVVE
jgi:putative tryptophan/tyrosine transport system substrate-binding protein